MEAVAVQVAEKKSEEILLWERLRTDDADAFTRLMQLYYKPMFRYGIRLHSDEELIRDAIQEVFVSIWERRLVLPSIQSVQFYLLKAVRKRILYALRRTKWEQPTFDQPDEYHFWAEYGFDTSLIAAEDADFQARKLELVLNSLAPRQKEVIHLRFFQNMGHEEVAEIMGMNRQSVYNLLHDTLRRLRQQWGILILALFGLSSLF